MKYIAQLKNNDDLQHILDTYDLVLLRHLKMLDFYVFEIKDESTVQQLIDSKLFEIISRDQQAKAFGHEDVLVERFDGFPVASASAIDPNNMNVLYWHHNAITNQNAASATNSTYFYGNDGSGVDIYVIDSGVNASNPELAGRVFSVPETDFEVSNNTDTEGHGTTVAMFAAGTRAGVATNANIWSARWQSSTASVAVALDAVYDHHINKTSGNPSVANMSFGVLPAEGNPNFFSDEDDTIKPMDAIVDDMVKTMIDAGIHCVISAGNGFERTAGGIWGPMISKIVSPARVSLVSDAITVGATNTNTIASPAAVPNNDMADFSNYDEAVTISAPGHSIPHLGWDESAYTGSYFLASGTSFSAPLVTGTIALWLNQDPTITPAQLKTQLDNIATSSVIPNLGGAHEATDGVLAWGGTINQIADTGPTTVSVTAYNYQTSLLTPNKFLFNPWQQYNVAHAFDITVPILTATDGNFGPLDGSTQMDTLLGQTPFTVTYELGVNAPSGVVINSSGVLIGTNVPDGSYTFDVIATNGYNTVTRQVTLDVPAEFPENWTVIGGTVSFTKA